MGEKSDAVELKPNQTVTGKSRESSKSRTPKKTDSEEKIHKAVQTLVSTKDKPLWVDEPKPVEKKGKKEKPVAPEVADVAAEAPIQKKSKNKKKNVATQTEPPSSPKSDDFIVKLKYKGLNVGAVIKPNEQIPVPYTINHHRAYLFH